MDYTTLGRTGMDVSRLCLGCMNFGLADSDKYPWSLGEAESREILERAIELGITFFDTSNSYSWGDSERVLGSVVAEHDRDALVLASKLYFAPEDAHPNAGGLSRKTVEQELQRSMDRLGVETLDLYQMHRWDDTTPIETTLRAFDDAISRGDIRHAGASSMWAHQFATAQAAADRLGCERLATMQNHYCLVYREEEREMLPYCAQGGVGVLPWSPLAKGYLARPHEELAATARGETDDRLTERPYATEAGQEINRRVQELAAERDRSMAQIALAWTLHKNPVTAPIVGVSSVEQLEDAVAAVDVDLSNSDLEYLEAPYEPLPIVGHE